MNVVDKALQTQLANLQTRAGKTLEELFAIIKQSGLTKHGEIRDLIKRELNLGHGDANTLVHTYLQSSAPVGEASPDARVDEIYSGPKADLRPIHDRLMAAIGEFGEFEIAPKKAYLSLRRKKQFATIGPATKTRVEVGLNMKDIEATGRLKALPPGGMCQYRIDVTDPGEVDGELIAWVRRAYDSAG